MTESIKATHEIECGCGYSNIAGDKDDAERAARSHEALRSHIGMSEVSEI